MAEIVNSDKLKLVLTQYGLDRITEAVDNPSLNLNITKIKLGSGKDYEYYVPSQNQEELEGLIEGLEFYIFDKELLEDEQTISFHTIITEDIGGFDIREVGLYETVDGEDHLFAVSTQQPFVKPSEAYNYYINIDYYIFLKATNFANVYDQIVLDVEHALVSEPNLEELMRTFLFAQGNLINQIGNNSRIIGYNRATQLYERIQENKKTFGYMTLYKNYSTLMDMVSSIDNIFSYWVFDYSRRESLINSIVDLSNNNYYLSTNKSLSSYSRNYQGFMSMFSFATPDSFQLGSDILINLYDSSTEEDSPFTMIFVIDPISTSEDRTLLAKSEYPTSKHVFEVFETANKEVKVRLFSDANNYITFTSAQNIVPNSAHTLILTYEPSNRTMAAYINSTKYILESTETGSYSHINVTPGTLYAFTYTPEIYTNTSTSSEITNLYNEDGTPYTAESDEFQWTISAGNALCNNKESTYAGTSETLHLYAWKTVEDVTTDVIYTKEETVSVGTQLYNSDFSVYEGETWNVNSGLLWYGDDEPTERDTTKDITLQIYKFKCTAEARTIWANSSNVNNIILLYNADNTVYTGNKWSHSDYVYYNGKVATLNWSLNKNNYMPPLTSYILNSSGKPERFINSSVGLISIVKEKLSEEKAKVFSLTLAATLGKNPYLSGGNS